jgi:SSS family solute:Na+ symporter
VDLSALGLRETFGTIDWIIVAGYLLATLWIGIRVNRYVGTLADYVVAGRSLKSMIGVATMVGSELGLVTVMYSAQKGFTGGFAAFHIGLVAGVVTLIVGMTGFIVVPLRRMRVMTIPEFYERRFGRGVRIAGGLLLALSGILNMGLFLKAGALFVTGMTGLTDPTMVKFVMTALILLVLFYTTMGGMVAVVITDYVQFVVLSFGMLLACYFALDHLGWESIVKTVETVHGEAGFDPLHADGFGADYVVWMIFTAGIVSCAVWQTAVMRACAASSTEVVKRLYAWSSVGFLVRFLLPQFLGICALSFFWNSDLARSTFFTSAGAPVADPLVTMQAMPIFLSQVLPVGVIGIIAAGMLAAFMSTHDSYLLCWATVLAHDVVGPARRGGLSERAELKLTRAFIIAIGAFLLIWSLWFPLGQDLWDYMAVTGAIYFTGAFALLLFGLYWPRASRVGAYLALTAGSTAVLGLAPIQGLLGISLASETVGLCATGAALVLMVLGSLLFPDPRTAQGSH